LSGYAAPIASLTRSLLALTVVALSSCGGSEPAPAAQPAPAPTPAAPRTASGAGLEYPAVVAKFTDALREDARQLIFNTKGVSLDGSRAKGTWSALARSLKQTQPQIEAVLRVAEMKDCTFAEVTIDKDARKLPRDLIELFRGMRDSCAILAADAAPSRRQRTSEGG
jgi:hypothetical protein